MSEKSLTIPFIYIPMPESKYDIKCPYTMSPTGITVHNTANRAPARNEIAYMQRNEYQISFHVAVDHEQVVQGIRFDRNAWHAGDGDGRGNRETIGIEICYSLEYDSDKYNKSEENAAKYIAWELYRRGWGLERLYRHYDWNGKGCPHRMFEGKKRTWGQFKELVNRELLNLKGVVSKPITPSSTTVKVGDIIRLKQNANKYYTGQLIPSWVKNRTHTVDAISGNKVRLKEIWSWVYLSDIEGQGTTTPVQETTTKTKGSVSVGEVVELNSTASKYVTGQYIPDWVKNRKHTVMEIFNNQVLLKEILSWVYLSDIKGVTKDVPKVVRVGSKVVIIPTAYAYTNTPTLVEIPDWVKGVPYTISQIDDTKILLREINSWVYIKDVDIL